MAKPQQAGTGKAEIPGGIPCPERWRYLHEYGAGTSTPTEKKLCDELGAAESQLRQRNKALHWILTNSHCDASRKAAAAALTEKP